MHGHHSLAAQKLSALPRPGFRGGGLIRGPGTGTSDSIPAEVPAGTYILPRDTTEATGLAARTLGDVPVALSNGEYEITPKQVQAIGASVLDILRGVTHEPVEQDEPDEGMERYANGGEVTRVGNSYSGGNVAGDIQVNGVAPGGTVSSLRPTSQPAAAPAPQMAAAPGGAAAMLATLPAPTQGQPMQQPGWAERNAQRNLEVTASSIQRSPERDEAQALLGATPAPAQRMDAASDPRSTVYGSTNPYAASNTAKLSSLGSSVGSRGVMEMGRPGTSGAITARNSFGDAAAATMNPNVTQLPRAREVLGRVGFANGGLVTDEERRQGLLSQIPTGGMTAPAADGSQNNPLNTELGRNAVNTLSALPGVTGLAARTAGGAARGASAAMSTERVVPAAWEVVQDGGALASRAAAPSGGALTRAASLTPEVGAVGVPGRAAQMLGAPPGQLAQRTATGIGEAMPAAGSAARAATPYADIVEPLALGASGAGQAANAAGQGAIGLGRVAASGGAAGLGAAALLAGDSSAGSPTTAMPNAPGAAPVAPVQPRATAAEALMGPPMSASNSITRDGNSYSGPANLSGEVSIRNSDGSLRAPASISTLPSGGGISAQNMGAADALASRENAASLGRLGLAGGAPGFSGVIGQQGNGNMWSRTPEQLRQDALTQVSSIDRRTAARGAAALNAMDAQALQGVKSQGDLNVAQLQDEGLLNRTLITERGNNTRAAITAQGQAAAAALKAQQGDKPPAGYRWTPTGSLEAIPGGPAESKVEDQQKQKEVGFDATRQTIGTINRLLANNNGLTGATGMVGIQRFFPGTDAADFAAQVETLKAQTFLPMVQQLRGMGALSNAEGDKLNAAVGALNFNMSEKAFSESLGRIRDQLAGALQKSGIDTKGASAWGLQPPSTVAEQGQGGQPSAASAAQRTVTRTGMANGRRVVQYSDGSLEYAD